MSIEDELKNGTIYTMKQSDVHKCPHYIMMPDHYRDDGTCKCNELGHQDMLEWGYVWNGKSWVNPE
jgi:hypothetical protein